MDIVYQFQGIEFEWDENKAQSNIENHGVTFEEATEVFFDPFYQEGDASSNGTLLSAICLPRGFCLSGTSNVACGHGSSPHVVSPAMKGSYMKKPEIEDTLHLRPRATESVSLDIPKDTLAAIKKVAAKRDMSHQALLKFYIGQGLRQDVAQFFGDQVLETAAHVLARHFQSEEEVASIMREIREEAVS